MLRVFLVNDNRCTLTITSIHSSRPAVSGNNVNPLCKSVPNIIGKGDLNVTEKEQKILNTFEKIIPNLTDIEKAQLLSFGEGLIFFKTGQTQKRDEEKQKEG